MRDKDQRGTHVERIAEGWSGHSPLTWRLDTTMPRGVVTAFGIPNHQGKPGNPFFHFYYSIAERAPEKLLFEVLTPSGTVLYKFNIPATFTKPGQYCLNWDGFNNEDVFDSCILNQVLEARLTAIQEGISSAVSLKFKCQYAKVDWIDIAIDRKLKSIKAILRTGFKDGGQNKEAKRSRTYHELLQLAKEGLEHYWSRYEGHQVAHGISMSSGEPYNFHLEVHNGAQRSIKSPAIVYQTNARARRSRNWELSRILFYNTGALKQGAKWYNKTNRRADSDFKQIAAHEIGHEILLAYGGHIYSKSHKGSSTILTQKPLGNFKYPPQGEIDLMIYYQETLQCPHPPDYNERSVASEDDVLALICLSQLKITLLSE